MLDKSSAFFAIQPPAPTAKNAFALERLRQAILWCELAPGATVSEGVLARQYRLGRAAVRSALTRLAAEGFATARPRQGWRIAPITGALLDDLLAARRLAETPLAALELAGDELERLRVLAGFLTELRRAADPQSLVTARQYDRQLMDALAQRAGSFVARWLGDVWRHGDRMLRFFERPDAHFAAPDRLALVNALAARNSAAAEAALLGEIQRFNEFLTRQMVRQARWGEEETKARRGRAGEALLRSNNRRKRTPVQLGDKRP
jgi:DNA-binding GntR family transcriptional regulator